MPDEEADDTIADAIRDAAAGPKKATGDNGSIEQFDLEQQIAADKYLAGKTAQQNGARGFKLTKIVPGGSA